MLFVKLRAALAPEALNLAQQLCGLLEQTFKDPELPAHLAPPPVMVGALLAPPRFETRVARLKLLCAREEPPWPRSLAPFAVGGEPKYQMFLLPGSEPVPATMKSILLSSRSAAERTCT